jgi:hypothetical protein
VQAAIKQWQEIRDPVAFYEIRKRRSFKADLESKVSEIKSSAAKTRESAAPLYLRKIEEEFKNTMYEVYLRSSRVEAGTRELVAGTWLSGVEKVHQQGIEINRLELEKPISEEKSAFSHRYYPLLSKKQKVSSEKLAEYCKYLGISIRNLCTFWTNYLCALSTLVAFIRDHLQHLRRSK